MSNVIGHRLGSRLIKERDAARQQLADASAAGKLYAAAPAAAATAAAAPAADGMEVEASGPAEVCQRPRRVRCVHVCVST